MMRQFAFRRNAILSAMLISAVGLAFREPSCECAPTSLYLVGVLNLEAKLHG